MYKVKISTFFSLISIFFLNLASADCWETQSEYEITRNCEVRIISIQSDSDSLEDEAHWLDYLQNRPSSTAEHQAGVSPKARKIFRPDDISSLYCEFNEDGLITEAYTIPITWDDAQR